MPSWMLALIVFVGALAVLTLVDLIVLTWMQRPLRATKKNAVVESPKLVSKDSAN